MIVLKLLKMTYMVIGIIKFQMYDKFRDGENLYFDLDVIIYKKLPNLIRKDFTLLYDYWEKE